MQTTSCQTQPPDLLASQLVNVRLRPGTGIAVSAKSLAGLGSTFPVVCVRRCCIDCRGTSAYLVAGSGEHCICFSLFPISKQFLVAAAEPSPNNAGAPAKAVKTQADSNNPVQ